MARVKLSYVYVVRDVDGQNANIRLNFDSNNDTGTLASVKTISDAFNPLLAAVTNGKIVQRSAVLLIDEAQGVGTDAEFPLVSQKAVLHFSNAQGSRATLSIPAPKEAIFKAPPSDDIVDPAQADVAALITLFQTDSSDVGNFALNLFQGGALSSRHRSRRRSIHTA